MNQSYESHVRERAAQGIPPLPLTAEQTGEVCRSLVNPEIGQDATLADLLAERVPPGVDPAAKIKAEFLAAIARGDQESHFLLPEKAVELLGAMLGGYNIPRLIELLDDVRLAPLAAKALKHTVFIFDNFKTVDELRQRGNKFAKELMESWAAAEWFTSLPELPKKIKVKIFKVDGETNTDDLSPAGHAPSRPDIPLHALSMGETRFPGGVAEIAKFRTEGFDVAFVGDTVGTGSSRKSATNSMIWHIGQDIPFIPNKRRGGVVIGEQIAPIFFNTFEDSGGLPIRCKVDKLKTGQAVTIDTKAGKILGESGEVLATFKLTPVTMADEYRAGGRVPLIIGRKLTAAARGAMGKSPSDVFAMVPPLPKQKGQGYTLAQKIVGRACGVDGVLPGETCEPKMTTVGSQDTTGPMTRDEMTELACLKFQADFTMQSFCHTAAYPKDKDKKMHTTLPGFFTERGGVALKPGDGIIHSWLNRFILPDTVGTGGDSHTRFPTGISFPAGSGLVAFAAALGIMPLDMPESTLVKVTGKFNDGITLRDLVNAIALIGIEKGLVDRPGAGAKNIFNGTILEIEGMPELTVEQAFELTCASAERSAAAGTVALGLESVVQYIKSNIALMKKLTREAYRDVETLEKRIAEAQAWVDNPKLLTRDDHAEFLATLEIDLASITEPVVACPNNPDNVQRLSAIAGDEIDEVFIGSCMTNIGHFRAAAKILAGCELKVKRLWLTPPTRMDRQQLEKEGVIAEFEKIGARVEIPGCSLCMGNQARVENDARVFGTSTRNFNNRLGDGAQVYLGSAELAAVVAKYGLVPTVAEYLAEYDKCVKPAREEIYRYLNFHEMPEYR
jgi:aconitate hydratase 2/2-methylisocitrate dehydratase